MGMRPVVEMQFIDFIACAYDMLTNYVATARYRAFLPCPMVVRGPSGGYVRGGPFHSQNPEAAFLHTPGLKIVYPATAEDAKGLIKAAIRDDDCVLFFEHKYLYRRIKDEMPAGDHVVPIGKARMAREGTDLSIITYAATVWKALEAAEQLEKEDGLSVEVLDLRSLLPLDDEAIMATVKKTNRVLIVHEDTRTGGIAGEITARINEQRVRVARRAGPAGDGARRAAARTRRRSRISCCRRRRTSCARRARWRRTDDGRRRAVRRPEAIGARRPALSWYRLLHRRSPGFAGGGMIGVFVAKIVGAVNECAPRPRRARRATGSRIAVFGAIIGAVVLPTVAIWRLRRARRRARTTRNEGDAVARIDVDHAPDGRIDRRGHAVAVAEEGRRRGEARRADLRDLHRQGGRRDSGAVRGRARGDPGEGGPDGRRCRRWSRASRPSERGGGGSRRAAPAPAAAQRRPAAAAAPRRGELRRAALRASGHAAARRSRSAPRRRRQLVRGAPAHQVVAARAQDGRRARRRAQRAAGHRASPAGSRRTTSLGFLESGAARRRRRAAARRRRAGRRVAHGPLPEPWPGDRVEPMSKMRTLTAEHMVMSRRTSAHVNSFFEVDFTRVARIRAKQRAEFETATGEKLTYLPFIIKAVRRRAQGASRCSTPPCAATRSSIASRSTSASPWRSTGGSSCRSSSTPTTSR